jgi:hypothetical protein
MLKSQEYNLHHFTTLKSDSWDFSSSLLTEELEGALRLGPFSVFGLGMLRGAALWARSGRSRETRGFFFAVAFAISRRERRTELKLDRLQIQLQSTRKKTRLSL